MARIAARPARPTRVKKAALRPRKEPSQERARQTVDAILQAAATVMVKDGYDRASTNRIAEAAGVSIGSLYQYFPSKEAVVRALIDRHEAKMLAVIGAHLQEISDRPIPELVRALVEALLEAHRVAPRLQKVLLEQGGAPITSSVDDAIEKLVRAAIESRRDELVVGDLDVAAFLLVTGVRTACHRAVVERPDLLARSTFVDELTALVVRYTMASPPL